MTHQESLGFPSCPGFGTQGEQRGILRPVAGDPQGWPGVCAPSVPAHKLSHNQGPLALPSAPRTLETRGTGYLDKGQKKPALQSDPGIYLQQQHEIQGALLHP